MSQTITDLTLARMTTTTCSITVHAPIIGSVTIEPHGDRASAACGVTDALHRGEATFVEYLAEAIETVVRRLSSIDRERLYGWLATIPDDAIAEVERVTYAAVPEGHRCKDGPPHYHVVVEHHESRVWATERDGALVRFYGPGPQL